MNSEHRSLLDIHDIVSPKHKAYTQLSGTFDTLRWELTKAEMVRTGLRVPYRPRF